MSPRNANPDTFFLPYQARWINDTSRLKLMEKGRQIGLSWATAYALCRRKAREDAKFDSWISSRDDLQARLFKEDCNKFAGILKLAAEDLGHLVIDPNKAISAYVLAFANGVRINSMSSNPDAQAGKRGDRVLDEFALHPDPRKLYSIAYPGITWGGSMEIISTHRGSQNFFNSLVKEIKHEGNSKGFSLHTVTLQTALDDGFLNKLKAKLPADDERQAMDEAAYFDYIRAGCADEESFQQEYMCVPSDDESAFLNEDLIAGCEYRFSEKWEFDLEQLAACKNQIFIGVDVGRKHDLTVMWVIEKVAGVAFTRRVVICDRESFDSQEAKLYEMLALPSVRRCCIDETGIGRQFTERAQKRFGEYKVEGVNFSAAVKEELAYPVRAAFEDKSVRIPSDKFIRADFRGIRKETTAAGNIRFTGERSATGHCDRFWAFALALHAGKNPGTVGSARAFERGGMRASMARRREVFA